jgi:hypothetical protein
MRATIYRVAPSQTSTSYSLYGDASVTSEGCWISLVQDADTMGLTGASTLATREESETRRKDTPVGSGGLKY